MPLSVAQPEVNAALPDEQLVQSCLNGSEEAWSALTQKYRNLIFSIPIRLGFPNDDAREIFQEVCLTLLLKLPQLRESRTLAAWLITITAHECSKWRSKELRYRVITAGDCSQTGQFTGALPENLAEEVQRDQYLREAVSELTPPRCRQLVHLLFFTAPALPYEEVARCLGTAKSSIGFIRGRCLKKLRQLLEEKGF